MPAVLELEKNRTTSVMAYFGEEGKLNAIIDTYRIAYCMSNDLLNKTRPGTDYTKFIKNNIS